MCSSAPKEAKLVDTYEEMWVNPLNVVILWKMSQQQLEFNSKMWPNVDRSRENEPDDATSANV